MSRPSRQLLAFISNTFLEALRNKMIYAVLIAAALAMGAATTFGALSLQQDERIYNNFVFFAGMLFLVALAIYQGVTVLHREIEHKTIFTVLSKPVGRGVFLLGKYLASISILAVCAILMFGFKLAVGFLLGYELTLVHLGVYYAGFLQLTMVVAVGFFFSTFSVSGPLLSALFTFAIFLIGSLTPQLKDASRAFASDDNPVHMLLDLTVLLTPDFEKLNLSYELTHGIDIPTSYLVHATGYSASVVIFALLFSHLIFSRRDFA